MPKHSSAKCYQDNKKKKTTKKLLKDTKVFLKIKKKKNISMAVNDRKIYQKMKNKSWLSIEKNVTKWENIPYYNYKKLFSFIKLCFFLKVWWNGRANKKNVFLLVENRFLGNYAKIIYFAHTFEKFDWGRIFIWKNYRKYFQGSYSFVKL